MKNASLKYLPWFLWLLLLIISCTPQPAKPEEGPKESPHIGYLAPDFTLETDDGSSVTMSSLRGKSVFINFWDIACPYCRFEMPIIQRMHDTYSSQGLVVLSINIQNGKSDVIVYKDRMKLTFPVLLDADGKVSEAYLIQGKPQSYFIDKDGIIQNIYIGELSTAKMEERVLQILGK